MNQNALKGLLIILVIFDHNEYAHKMFPSFLAGFSFHVVGFLALPFLRPADKCEKKTLEKMFFSYYYPFFWIVCGMALVNIVIGRHVTAIHFLRVLLALYSGNSNILESTTQMSMLWFLPSFLSLMLMRSITVSLSAYAKTFFLLVIFILHLLVGRLAATLCDYLPLGLLPAIYAIPVVLVIIFLYHKVLEKIHRLLALLASSVVFLIVKYWQIRMGLSQELGFAEVADYRDISAMVINDLEAITGTLVVFQLARFSWGGFIEKCGQYSLQVYLFHAFVALAAYNLIEKGLPDTAISVRLVVSMSVTIVVSSLISVAIMKSTRTKRLLFPRSWRELTHQNNIQN